MQIEIEIEISAISWIFPLLSIYVGELHDSLCLNKRGNLSEQKTTSSTHCQQKPVTCNILHNISPKFSGVESDRWRSVTCVHSLWDFHSSSYSSASLFNGLFSSRVNALENCWVVRNADWKTESTRSPRESLDWMNVQSHCWLGSKISPICWLLEQTIWDFLMISIEIQHFWPISTSIKSGLRSNLDSFWKWVCPTIRQRTGHGFVDCHLSLRTWGLFLWYSNPVDWQEVNGWSPRYSSISLIDRSPGCSLVESMLTRAPGCLVTWTFEKNAWFKFAVIIDNSSSSGLAQAASSMMMVTALWIQADLLGIASSCLNSFVDMTRESRCWYSKLVFISRLESPFWIRYFSSIELISNFIEA